MTYLNLPKHRPLNPQILRATPVAGLGNRLNIRERLKLLAQAKTEAPTATPKQAPAVLVQSDVRPSLVYKPAGEKEKITAPAPAPAPAKPPSSAATQPPGEEPAATQTQPQQTDTNRDPYDDFGVNLPGDPNAAPPSIPFYQDIIPATPTAKKPINKNLLIGGGIAAAAVAAFVLLD